MVKCLSLKRGIIQSNIHRIVYKKLIRSSTSCTQTVCLIYHDSSSSGSPDILFKRLLKYTICQSGKREIIQPNIYRILPKLERPSTPWTQNLYAKYYDPSSSSSPDILFIRFHMFTMHKLKKRHNSTVTSPTDTKKKMGPLIFHACSIYNLKFLSLNGS